MVIVPGITLESVDRFTIMSDFNEMNCALFND